MQRLAFRCQSRLVNSSSAVGFMGQTTSTEFVEPKWVDCEKSGRNDDEYGVVVTLRYVTPSAEARARVDEIVAAYGEWRAAQERKPRGYKAAKRAYEEAERIESRLEQRIHSIQATTIEGVTAKARCAELYEFEPGVYGDFSVSAAEDLLALNAEVLEESASRRIAAEESPDPAFALIAEKRAADVAHCRSIDACDAFDKEGDRSSEAALIAEDNCFAACHAVNEVDWRLARTRPAGTRRNCRGAQVCQRDRGCRP